MTLHMVSTKEVNTARAVHLEGLLEIMIYTLLDTETVEVHVVI